MLKLLTNLGTTVLVVILLSVTAIAGDTWLLTFPLDVQPDSWPCNFQCHDNRPGGNDYSCNTGTNVLAAEDGYVHIHDDPDGYGTYLTEDIAYYQLYYGHLSEVLVNEGQFVTQGSVIAKSGSTGWSTGPHLHFEVRSSNMPIDPYNINHWLWVSPPPFNPVTLYSQLAYSGTCVGKSHSNTLVLLPGSSAECWIDFKCNPPFYWSSNGNSSHYVALHSVASNWTDMEDSPVITGTTNLLDDDGSTADPNGVARFNFTITAPQSPGTYTLRARVYHPHSGTFITGTGPDVTFNVQVVSPPQENTSYYPISGDFNGDGLADVGLYDQITGNWYIALHSSTSNRFIPQAEPWLTGWGTGIGNYLPTSGDVDGDGLWDLILYQPVNGRWAVAKNYGGYFAQLNGTYIHGCWYENWGTGEGVYFPASGDVDGDGLWDAILYQPVNGRWPVAKNYGDHFTQINGPYARGCWYENWGTGVGVYQPVSGDVDGDGLSDILLYQPVNGRWAVAKNYGGYFAQLNGPYVRGCWLANWGTGVGVYMPISGDVDNDGLTDILLYVPSTGRWAVAKNYGGYFAQINGPYINGCWLVNWGIQNEGTPKIATPETENPLPADFTLSQNYPNPFNPVTNISYSLPVAADVCLEIYNVLGQRVATLANERQVAGEHSIQWDAHQCPSGIYFYRLTTDQVTETKKMIILK
ncbi:MAG: peptidoglycan DD-metalloendopeptidase family protein [Patescibacteria group bacterium]|jgi:hypothetical protein